MASSLWPNSIMTTPPPRGMIQMLNDAIGDIITLTGGKVRFHVDTVGVGFAGAVKHVRYNGYLVVEKLGYLHLLFIATTPVGSPFPAELKTPEDDNYAPVTDEITLRLTVEKILARPRTTEIVTYLISISPP